ncbi:PIN domain-containing protein [Streptomyces sp. NPDC055992]|uniref:PIN domain-containing protein n=1 Tax=Streptomyces sp. NPDC055992 TaxID=3345673 RepID=UPI0035E08C86
MIILDTNVLKGTSLRGPEAELLRAIRNSRVERIGAPWIVIEELAAQQALLYEAKYEAAKEAMETLDKATPWSEVSPPRKFAPERARGHWRNRYTAIVEVMQTSPQAYQDALWREANYLAPCKQLAGGEKTGARDAAIWLTAVEYARENPEETVYFVSADGDFGDGSSFAPPMDEDVRELGDRFVFMKSLGDVLTKFAAESSVDEAELASLLEDPANQHAVMQSIRRLEHFPATIIADSGQLQDVIAWRWKRRMHIRLDSVADVRAYEIAGHRWYTATARWLASGAVPEGRGYDLNQWVHCSVKTRVLSSPTAPSKGMTVLAVEQSHPITAEDVSKVPEPVPLVPLAPAAPLETALARHLRSSANLSRSDFARLQRDLTVLTSPSLARQQAMRRRLEQPLDEAEQLDEGQDDLPDNN